MVCDDSDVYRTFIQIPQIPNFDYLWGHKPKNLSISGMPLLLGIQD